MHHSHLGQMPRRRIAPPPLIREVMKVAEPESLQRLPARASSAVRSPWTTSACVTPGTTVGGMANELGASASPYLRQHAGNPVEWREWGAAAFAEARERGVPVFLSVGYSACHWCQVIAGPLQMGTAGPGSL
ncbi:DUF255 domain-containing protein [Kribbella solani]|uniref:DUF255 domain-containing protein n=1 Tax=Kribbella solani TaxID=236067 RepID=UPI0038D476FC